MLQFHLRIILGVGFLPLRPAYQHFSSSSCASRPNETKMASSTLIVEVKRPNEDAAASQPTSFVAFLFFIFLLSWSEAVNTMRNGKNRTILCSLIVGRRRDYKRKTFGCDFQGEMGFLNRDRLCCASWIALTGHKVGERNFQSSPNGRVREK